MTVKELIHELGKLDPGLPVVYDAYSDANRGPDFLEVSAPLEVEWMKPVVRERWEGFDSRRENQTGNVVQVVRIA